VVLDDTLREIYSRQILMKEIGVEGQQKLADASVLVIGCGGLGAPTLSYLAAMGIGHLGFCDCDVVSLSNMNRQLLFSMDNMDQPKASLAEKRLLGLNPKLKTSVYDCVFDEQLASQLVPQYDIAVDCLDNFDTRFILNDACVNANKPFVHAGIGEFYGQLMTITPGFGPCLRCLFPNKKKEEGPKKPFGVVGSTPGVLGSMQALEVLKFLLGLPVANDGLVVYDGLNLSIEKIGIEPAAHCICRTLCDGRR